MKNKLLFSNQRPYFLIFCVLTALVVTSGCEPLRKKFVRKKKDGEETMRPEVILDPDTYPGHQQSILDEYRSYYSQWKIWHQELVVSFDEDRNDKKLFSVLERMREQIISMQLLLNDEEKLRMAGILKDIDSLSVEFGKLPDMRNNVAISSKIRALGRSVRDNFAPDKMRESFRVPQEAKQSSL